MSDGRMAFTYGMLLLIIFCYTECDFYVFSAVVLHFFLIIISVRESHERRAHGIYVLNAVIVGYFSLY